MKLLIRLLSKALDPYLRHFEKFSWFLKIKYFLWDKLVNNQEVLLSASIRSLNSYLPNKVISSFNLSSETELAVLLESGGSDKSTRHNYHQIYGPAIRQARGNILEIGLGSSSTNQYASGLPGGGLEAFKAINSEIKLFGADIDQKAIDVVKFDAFYVDQTNTSSLNEMVLKLESFGKFSIIIDDGFHEFSANIRTFNICKKLMESGGVYFIEDIHESHIEIWNLFINVNKLDAEILDLRQFRKNTLDNIIIKINF